jgi:hypothetical protein
LGSGSIAADEDDDVIDLSIFEEEERLVCINSIHAFLDAFLIVFLFFVLGPGSIGT